MTSFTTEAFDSLFQRMRHDKELFDKYASFYFLDGKSFKCKTNQCRQYFVNDQYLQFVFPLEPHLIFYSICFPFCCNFDAFLKLQTMTQSQLTFFATLLILRCKNSSKHRESSQITRYKSLDCLLYSAWRLCLILWNFTAPPAIQQPLDSLHSSVQQSAAKAVKRHRVCKARNSKEFHKFLYIVG